MFTAFGFFVYSCIYDFHDIYQGHHGNGIGALLVGLMGIVQVL